MNGQPLRVADPRTLGAFTLQSRLAEHASGVVFAGQDAAGQWVAVAVLDSAAAADPAVRDRFEAAIGLMAQQGQVRDAAPRGPVAWAALAYEGDGPADAAGLLNAAVAPAAGWVPQHQSAAPNFGAPHPHPAGPGAAGTGTRGKSSTPLVVGLAAAVVLLVIVSVAVVVVAVRSPEQPPGPQPTASGPVAQSSSPSAPPSTATASPSPTRADHDGSPGLVAGPTYGKGEDTYHMDLTGMPFEFDAPGTWGCARRDQAPFTSRWICLDEGGTFPPQGSGAGGLVAVMPCPAPCGDAQRKELRKHIVVDEADWRRIDATTMYAGIIGENKEGKQVVRVAMSHVFAAQSGGAPDTAVAVQLTGPPDQKETMQKLINEIRERTP